MHNIINHEKQSIKKQKTENNDFVDNDEHQACFIIQKTCKICKEERSWEVFEREMKRRTEKLYIYQRCSRFDEW